MSVAVVTGGGAGQGRATALRLARAGYEIAVLDVSGGQAQQVALEIAGNGARSLALTVDVADAAAVTAAFDRVRTELGPVQVLAAAAGIYEHGGTAVERDVGDARRIFGVNALGTYYCAVAAAQQMIEAEAGGRIVLWSSIAAHLGMPGDAAYCGSKAAVEGMGRAFAAELKPYGVTVNVIAPGAIDTQMIAGTDLSYYEWLLPPGAIGTADEIAELVAYLVLPETRFLTGAVIGIDGGIPTCNGPFMLAKRLQQRDRERS
jgi:3-oxoacyl-[acyl-carrier protein] reductase